MVSKIVKKNGTDLPTSTFRFGQSLGGGKQSSGGRRTIDLLLIILVIASSVCVKPVFFLDYALG